MDSLSVGSVLQSGKYKIIKALGQGGFGITYLAEQVALGRKVAIKEFFMKDYCDREDGTSHVSVPTENSRDLVNSFKNKFVKEAQMIASLRNPHIVSIHDIFEENGTAYYVMEYLNNGSLIDIIKQRGPLPEAEAIQYITQVGDALSYIHERNILHLDVKPSNILLNDDGNVVLIDFGISKRYDESGGQTSTTPVGVSKGYAPIEQYQQGSVTKFSPATDVYSLGATLFFLLSGKTPPEAADVYEDGLPDLGKSVSRSTKDAILIAMKPNRKERLQSIQSFVNLLCAQISSTDKADSREESKVLHFEKTVELDEETVISSADKVSSTKTTTKKEDDSSEESAKPTKKPSPAFIIGAILAYILVGCICFFIFGHRDDKISIAGQTEYSVSFSNTDKKRSLSFNKNFAEGIAFYGVPDWCSIYLSDKELVIDCLSNNTENDRKAVIQLSRDGKQEILATLSIVQSGIIKPTKTTNTTNTVAASNEQSQAKQASLIHLQESRIELQIGESHTIKYSITPAEASSHKVTWTSSNTEIATVNSNGVVVARKVGSTYITATVDGVSSSCIVNAEKKNVSESTSNMYLAREEVSLYVGQKSTLHAFNYGSTLRWESANHNIATVSEDGQVTAIAPGTVKILAIGKEIKTCVVTIKEYNSSNNHATSSSTSVVSIKIGEQVQLKVYGQTVSKWESDNLSIARVSSSGILTGVASGSTNVWAYYGSELKLFHVTVSSSSYTSSTSSSNSYSSSSSSGSTRTIYSKESTIKVGERITAQLSEGRIDKWEINSTAAQYVTATSNGTLTAIKAGNVSIWGYIGSSPKLFKLTIVGTGSYVPQDRAPYFVTSKEFTMYVGDQITAKISDGEITRWEIGNHNKDYFSADGKVLRAKKSGYVSVWGYVGTSPKLFKITIRAR